MCCEKIFITAQWTAAQIHPFIKNEFYDRYYIFVDFNFNNLYRIRVRFTL